MTPQTQTLTDFLLARIAEDEERIRAADEHYSPFEREWEWCPAALTEPLGDIQPGPCTCNFPKAQHRGLAECEAKRRIVELGDGYRDGVVGLMLRWLALPYADHDDFRKEWRL